jgi:hypothetical protein
MPDAGIYTEVKVYTVVPSRPLHIIGSSTVQKTILLDAIQKEIHRHDLSYFVDEPSSVAQGGKGVVVSGCPAKSGSITMKRPIDGVSYLAPKLSGPDSEPRSLPVNFAGERLRSRAQKPSRLLRPAC